MDKDLIDFIISQGIFAILFLYLLFYILKENSKREELYQKVIDKFSILLIDIKKDIDDIKKNIKKS